MVEFWTPANNGERQMFDAIIDRAMGLGIYNADERLDAEMDLSATMKHTPMNLPALLGADNFNFGHDLGGIKRHINRTTGALEDCFLPRFALPQPQAEPATT